MSQSKTKSNFFQKVFDLVKLIPSGKVTSYGAIARYIGSPQSARMVGWALNSIKNTNYSVPAHRVVNRKGLLTGKLHFGSSNTMHNLLVSEGLVLEDNQIMNFVECFWDPNIVLNSDLIQ